MTGRARDNGGIGSHGPLGGFETRDTLLMGTRSGRPEHTPEAEPVLVVVDGGSVSLILDDEEVLVLDRVELQAALAHPGEVAIVCEACNAVGVDEEPACDHFAAWWVTARGWGEWRPWRQDA